MQYHGHRRPLRAGRRRGVGGLPSAPAAPAVTLRTRRRAVRPRPSPTTSRARSSRPARVTPPGRARSATATQSGWSAPTTCSSATPRAACRGSTSPARRSRPADEQQRLLANLITETARTPIPRFWYLPNGYKAAVVLTGDDHGRGGDRAARRSAFQREPGRQRPRLLASIDWQCVRSTLVHLPRRRAAGRRAAPAQTTRARASRSRCISRSTGSSTTAARSRRSGGPSDEYRLASSTSSRRECPAAAAARSDHPHPLHRVERLRQPAAAPSSRTASASTRTTTTGPVAGSARSPGLHDGLGLPAALRQRRRLAHRRLPGHDAAQRRAHRQHARRPAPRRRTR